MPPLRASRLTSACAVGAGHARALQSIRKGNCPLKGGRVSTPGPDMSGPYSAGPLQIQ